MAFLHLSKTDFFDAMLSTDRQQGTLSAAIEDLVKEHAKEDKDKDKENGGGRDNLMVNGSRHEQESAACKEMARCLAQVDDTKIDQMLTRARKDLDDCSQRLRDVVQKSPQAVSYISLGVLVVSEHNTESLMCLANSVCSTLLGLYHTRCM
jgi:hypothetical protein